MAALFISEDAAIAVINIIMSISGNNIIHIRYALKSRPNFHSATFSYIFRS